MADPSSPHGGLRRRGVLAPVALLVAAGLVACTGNSNTTGSGAGDVVRGGTLVAATDSTAGLLNPAVTGNGGVHANSELMFNGLLARDPDDKIVGDLAESYKLSDDGQHADFRLRSGMRWHDGQPVTAADVDFTFREALLRYFATPAASLGPIFGMTGTGNTAVVPPEAITMPDGPTGLAVRFNFRVPYYVLFDQLNVTLAPIIPRHLYEPCSVRALGESATLGNATGQVCEANNSPIGSGPFKFVRRDAAKIEVTANRQYHRADLPYLDRVVFLATGNASDALRARRDTSGSVDVASISGNNLPAFRDNPAYTVTQLSRSSGGSNCLLTIAFNLWPKGMPAAEIRSKAPDSPYESPYFRDKAVRQALFTAIDRKGMFEKIAFGQGRVATSPYSSRLPGYQPQQLPGDGLPNIDAQIAAANGQLDAVGWKDSNGSGTRDKDGVELAFDVTHFDTGTQPDFARQMTADLARVGVAVTPRPLTNAAQQQSLADRTYDSTIYSSCQGDHALLGVKRSYAGDDIRATAFSNVAGYTSTAMDALWERVAVTMADQNEANHAEIQRLGAEEVPYVVVVESVTTRVNRNVCQGLNLNNTGLYMEAAWCEK